MAPFFRLSYKYNEYDQTADIIVSQNYAVMHSRSPWVGKRTVLAALWNDNRVRIIDYPQNESQANGVVNGRL